MRMRLCARFPRGLSSLVFAECGVIIDICEATDSVLSYGSQQYLIVDQDEVVGKKAIGEWTTLTFCNSPKWLHSAPLSMTQNAPTVTRNLPTCMRPKSVIMVMMTPHYKNCVTLIARSQSNSLLIVSIQWFAQCKLSTSLMSCYAETQQTVRKFHTQTLTG